MANKNYRKSCVLAHLNQETDWTAMEMQAKEAKIQKLQEEINTKNTTFNGKRGTNMVEMLTQICKEIKKQSTKC